MIASALNQQIAIVFGHSIGKFVQYGFDSCFQNRVPLILFMPFIRLVEVWPVQIQQTRASMLTNPVDYAL